MCGEKSPSWKLLSLRMGSPPRVRGKGQRPAFPPAGGEITPAYAGKRVVYSVCKEIAPGSPPHVRGKARPAAPTSFFGITPACAGKRGAGGGNVCSRQDHPRVCGEKRGRGGALKGGSGSPPRVRGKVAGYTQYQAQCRITPACAGKRKPESRMIRNDRDHPRVCGEKAGHQLIPVVREGSPPRVRGKD